MKRKRDPSHARLFSQPALTRSLSLSLSLSLSSVQNLIFRFLQSRTRVQVWLFEQTDLRIEGQIVGFDEYMNLVLDGADEVSAKRGSRKALGRILLKGDTITLMRPIVAAAS